MDTGAIGDRQVCPPQILSFSLKTNKLLSRYSFPIDQYTDKSLFVTPVIDVRDADPTGKCRNTFVYIADVTEFALIVYDHMNQRSWRIRNNLFYPYPTHGTFEIRQETFDLMDGILGMAISPIKQDGDRILYFHSLASVVESWVPTSVIRWELVNIPFFFYLKNRDVQVFLMKILMKNRLLRKFQFYRKYENKQINNVILKSLYLNFCIVLKYWFFFFSYIFVSLNGVKLVFVF